MSFFFRVVFRMGSVVVLGEKPLDISASVDNTSHFNAILGWAVENEVLLETTAQRQHSLALEFLATIGTGGAHLWLCQQKFEALLQSIEKLLNHYGRGVLCEVLLRGREGLVLLGAERCRSSP